MLTHNATAFTFGPAELPSLQKADYMFAGINLKEWGTDLPRLVKADAMFAGTKLTEWNVDIPKLEVGRSMFACGPLESFEGSLSNLVNGSMMFFGNSGDETLTEFKSPLPKLLAGWDMFTFCDLSTASVQNIAETINDVSELPDWINLGPEELEVLTERYCIQE